MKNNHKHRLKKIELKLQGSCLEKPLLIVFEETADLLIVKFINIEIDSPFKWNGCSLWMPDNGRRVTIGLDFAFTDAYLEAQPEIATILIETAEGMGKRLALNYEK